MVSSKIKLKLRETFEALKNSKLDIHNYSHDDFDAVFDILSTETFIAGIADKIVNGLNIDQQEKEILKKKFLENKRWINTEGKSILIEHNPEVLKHAQLIERVQQLCTEIIGF